MPDNVPIQQKIGQSFLKNLKQPSFLLNGEVIWQARDSSLPKELHGLTIRFSIEQEKSD